MFLSACEGEDVGSGEDGDSEEGPESSGNGLGGGVDPFVDVVGAVVGNGAESNFGESSEFGDVVSAVAGTVEVVFDGLKSEEGVVQVVGVVLSLSKGGINGLVGSEALGESLAKVLSVIVGSFNFGSVGSVVLVGGSVVNLGPVSTEELLVLPEEGVYFNTKILGKWIVKSKITYWHKWGMLQWRGRRWQ